LKNFNIKVQISKETQIFLFRFVIRTASFVYNFHAAPLVDFLTFRQEKQIKKLHLVGAFQSFRVELQFQFIFSAVSILVNSHTAGNNF
jgi:hypothetical protein